MDREQFIRASVTTRVYEKNLLTSNNIQRLVDSSNLSEAISLLNDSSYGEFMKDINRNEEYEKALLSMLKESYKKIRKISPDKNLIVFLEEKYNFHNLKVLVKELIQDADYSTAYMDIGTIDLSAIKKAIKSDFKTFDDVYIIYAKNALDLYEDTKDPQDIDLSLDRDFYQKLLIDAKNLTFDSLVDFTRQRIDLVNLKSLLRIKGQNQSIDLLKKALIDGGFINKNNFILGFNQDVGLLANFFINEKTYPLVKKALDSKDLKEATRMIEKAIDDYLLDFAKDSKKVSYGPEVILGYLINREMEIKNLRIILVAKQNMLSREFIEERLRNLYV
ncbi:V-type ATP synthase subunit C [Anaerococcus sp. AGMB00486]|uniref:V-type ATP synthase subunit C n=1 Tax=Anaerococcus faecalis TaxID=2742993 RepID=A0ABX2N927_9FIRM|nr:V-type ATP synthase subunit C [Anaerococcus faecalis]NVF11212.1 V-type ATP synthase subunit C [Anaerococcus faecalis]